MMSRWYIYALRCPITWEVRYVGKANDPARRLKRHINESAVSKYRSGRWVHTLVRGGAKPLMEILDAGRGDGHGAAERAWIAEMRARGASLTNTAIGGRGGSGPCSEEVRLKIAAASRGVPRSASAIAKMRITKTGQKQSAKTVAKRSASLRGHPVSIETRAKIAATKIGKPRSPETNAKISAALTGRKPSDETRAKLRAAHAARKARRQGAQ